MSSGVRPKHSIKVRRRIVTPDMVPAELERLETKYGFMSSEFRRRMELGTAEHTDEFVEWEFYCKLADQYGIALR